MLIAGLALLLLLLVGVAPVLASMLPEDSSLSSSATDLSSSSGAATVVAELPERRTANTREYQLSDGSRKLEVHLGPVNYKDASGDWQAIDTGIGASSKEGFARENVTNAFKSYFAEDGDRRGTMRVDDGEFSLEVSPLGRAKTALSAGAAQPSKDSVLYADLFDETSARYSVLPGAVKEELILASAKAPSTFRFAIDAPGLTPKTREDGSIAADGLEASQQTTIASSPQLPSVLRTIDSRDDGRRVTSATIDTGSGSPLVSQSLFDGAGRPQRQWGTTGGGSGYTAAAETTDAYTYDPNSGLKIADNLQLASVGTAGPLVSAYTYSVDGRLVSATTNGYSCVYGFNPLGNLIDIIPQGGTSTTLTYDAGSRLQTAQTGTETTYFSWDTANGRRTSQGSTSNSADPRIRYTYTGTGRLATYVDENPQSAGKRDLHLRRSRATHQVGRDHLRTDHDHAVRL